MKITIDTKEDSNEEIKKVIDLLSNLLKSSGAQSVPNNIFESNEMPNVMGIFDTPVSQHVEPPKPEEPVKRDIPKVELY